MWPLMAQNIFLKKKTNRHITTACILLGSITPTTVEDFYNTYINPMLLNLFAAMSDVSQTMTDQKIPKNREYLYAFSST